MLGKPTLSTVAKEAGVSIPTVSQVMRGTGRISEQTRERVLTAAKKLHFVPDSRAASMRSGENREIGFVVNQLLNPFNAEVVSGVVDLLETEGYMVSILDTRDDADRQSRHLDSVIRHGRGGLLWVPALDTSDDTFERLSAHGLPTVTFLRHLRRDIDHVGIRNADATLTGTRYLADLGHIHIAYLGGTDMTIVRKERISGYKQAMLERELGEGVVWSSADNKLGACIALSRLGLAPGQDVSVVGFDDIKDAAVGTPPLSTMAVCPEELGRSLARTLLDRIQNPDMPVKVTEILAELIVRESTGQVPTR